MKDYLGKEEWKITENEFHPEHNKITESIFSLGNGYMGHRGMFEEKYTGETMQGSYLAGIYYPDKTRVGWWKIGYPEYFAKVLNSVHWIGIDLEIDGKILDLNEVTFGSFYRELDMKHSKLKKEIAFDYKGHSFEITSERFCSADTKELGAIKYNFKSSNFTGKVKLIPYLDFNIRNEDANYDEVFWMRERESDQNFLSVSATTKKTDFTVEAQMSCKINSRIKFDFEKIISSGYVAEVYDFNYEKGEEITLEKYVCIGTSFYFEKSIISKSVEKILAKANTLNFEELKSKHVEEWNYKWYQSDIVIGGDLSAQQAIRFNIFHMNQTYTGDDPRLNIGPKGFTGEKYGGSTYWDTEAYCLPFYLSTSAPKVSKNLLVYRYNHLAKAIENAEKLGFRNGAALYPMVTMNGEECHNEWEITFEEIHRNGAIAYAIYDYIRYTGDEDYLAQYGLEVLIAISRFWSQRVNYSESLGKFVILGVTGPNEYENNVDNNWYTNYLAVWCLKYTKASMEFVKESNPNAFQELIKKTKFDSKVEVSRWEEIISNMHFPYDEKRDMFLQQDGFLNKEIKSVDQIDSNQRPINQNWSWDRILRSCYIKQADTLQGMYFFEEDFDQATLKKHFDFYEPLTVHESSLSPCVHAILACKLGYEEKAYEMYLRTARLDLDDYNNDTEDGLHITSMAGTWMSIVKGFGGMRVSQNVISFDPCLPEQWEHLSFKVRFRESILLVKMTKDKFEINNQSDKEISVNFSGVKIDLKSNELQSLEMQQSN